MTHVVRTLAQKIAHDIKWDSTPDRPSLRYNNGEIEVFMWDEQKSEEEMKQLLSGQYHSQVTRKYVGAETVDKYIPMYNITASSSTYPVYCLKDHEQMDTLKLPEYSKGDPLPMKGTIYGMSLQALEELDTFYENTNCFDRVPIRVKVSGYSSQYRVCWAYLNSPDQMGDLNVKTNIYELQRGIDLTPFATKKSATKDVYAY